MSKKVNARGFTLLEILLVVGIIAILAGIVILAINPTKQLGDTRNAQRRSDVLTILNAIYQYSLDNNGALPETMDATANDNDCFPGGVVNTDSDLASALTELTASSTYITSMPTDPSTDGESDYVVIRRTSGRVTVCAPNSVGEGNIAAEDYDNVISVTR